MSLPTAQRPPDGAPRPRRHAPRPECVILSSGRRALTNSSLRQLLRNLAPEGQARAVRQALIAQLWPLLAEARRGGRPVRGSIQLTGVHGPVRLTAVCEPFEGRVRRAAGGHCTLFLRGTGRRHAPSPVRPAPPVPTENNRRSDGSPPELGAPGSDGPRGPQPSAQASTDLTEYPWPLFLLDPNGRLTFLNGAGQRFLGQSFGLTEAPSGLNPIQLVHPEERPAVSALWQEAVAYGRPLQLCARLLTHDGQYRTGALRVDLRRDAEGALLGWVGTCLDVAEHAWVAPGQPRADDTVGNSFLTVASHELRTPLTSLQLTLQLALQKLQRDRPSGRVQHLEGMVARSLKQTHRLIEVVSDILDATRIQHDKLQLRHTRVDLSRLIEDTVALFDRPFAEVGSRVVTDLMPNLWGHWDVGRIEQVVFDLLANVLKHAPGSAVTVRSRTEGQDAVVEITDDGPGIPLRLHESIFGRFGRAAECRGISGLGLGLYLCRRIVADHGGTLTVHANEGRGSCFRAQLPLAGLRGAGAEAAQPPRARRAGGSGDAPRPGHNAAERH